MKITFIILFICTLINVNSFAAEFKFNNKNLNSIGALVCLINSESSQNLRGALIYTHKTTVNKKKIGPRAVDEIIEIQGTCNNLVNTETLKTERMGDEFFIQIDRSRNLQGSGKLGIKKITIDFKNSNLQGITVEDPLLLTKVSKDISNSTWAKSNQIFSFTGEKLSLRFSRKIAATETGGVLDFNSIKFFSVWSDQAFGCSSATIKLSESQCEKLKNI